MQFTCFYLLLSNPISVFSRCFHDTLGPNNLNIFHIVSQVQKAMEQHLQSLSMVLMAALLMAMAVPACRISEFPCRNGHCIRLDRYCDAVDDCGDKSDEPRYCTGKYTELSKLQRKMSDRHESNDITNSSGEHNSKHTPSVTPHSQLFASC